MTLENTFLQVGNCPVIDVFAQHLGSDARESWEAVRSGPKPPALLQTTPNGPEMIPCKGFAPIFVSSLSQNDVIHGAADV